MNLSDHDLRQMDDDYLRRCIENDRIFEVSSRMLRDLKESRDRLNQTPDNSSRPPSSRAPWESSTSTEETSEFKEATDKTPEQKASGQPESSSNADTSQTAKDQEQSQDGIPRAPDHKLMDRKAGRQRGATGHGRTQKLAITHTVHHHPPFCAACGGSLPHTHDSSQPYTGWDEIDIVPPTEGQIGLHLTCTRHLMYEERCNCGHHTRATHYQAPPDPLWENTALGEWRMIGPNLAAAIVFLSLRMRLSRARIREFCFELLGLYLSIGVIDETIREAGRASALLEESLVNEIERAAMLNIDETSWKESAQALWLWVFVSTYTVLYYIGPRTLEMLTNVLTESFKGTAMTDGYHAYRHLPNRLRCWCHLLRKLQGLADSTDQRVAGIGKAMLETFCALMEAIYAARDTGPPENISTFCEEEIARLRTLCEDYQRDVHNKLGAVAREFLLDWDVIMRQVKEPSLPLTNNAAERALRHWVIARRINQGTRNEAGSRTFALLASVIDTCRRRGASAWRYLATVIAAARKGIALPPLPLVPVGE